ncbi:MAG TPA: division/cell wall cluster transcriptional repressor MraZ [Chitinophagales bacterium]|nr:division/cell wall cluster transcriptional repressor MraZ [Chitinophagales bacterium]HRK28714.1 division/cell wall cluster transcriptional repressor MraZ [Chitinophagales bacterium]
MSGFLGEIECKIDPKGRLAMPVRFVKQMPAENNSGFVVNRGIEKCLTLYTLPEWERVTRELEILNLYNEEERTFLRQFFRGATEVMFDGSSRILLPKRLMDYANIETDVILLGYFNRIEIWSPDIYDSIMNIDAAKFATLAGNIMGSKTNSQ